MTQQEIQERNQQIALMLGYVNTTPTDKDFNIFENRCKPFAALPNMIETMSMKFHSDWNWLMEAVEFIEKLGYESLLGGSEYYYPEKDMRYIQHFIKEDEVIYHESKNKIEAVFIAVSDFAKLYNENKI